MAAVQTVFINKDWQTSSNITDTTNPFGVDTQVLIDGFGTFAFPDPPFVPGSKWDTEYIWFAPCSKDNPYEILDLDHVEHAEGSEVPHVTIISAQTEYKGSATVFCKDLDIHDKLVVVSSASKFTFGSVENELTESILITGNGTVFNVSDTIQGCSGFFNNLGTLTVQDKAVFSTVSITNGAGEPIFISGSSTMFNVTGLFNNIGEVTVNGATVTAGAFTNQGGNHHVTISGGSFTVTNAFSNDASLSVENGAKFKAGSFTNGRFVTISGSNTSFETGDFLLSGGTVSVQKGAAFKSTGTVTVNMGKEIFIEDSTFNASSIDVGNGGSITLERATLTTTNANVSGTISIEDSTFSANTTTLADSGGTISITSNSVNGSPSEVSLGYLSMGTWGGAQCNLGTDWKSSVSITGYYDSGASHKISIDFDGVDLSSVQEKAILDWGGEGTPNYQKLLTDDSWAVVVNNPLINIVNGDLMIKKTYGTVYVQENGSDDPSTAKPDAPYFATVAGAAAVTPAQIIVRDYSEDSDHLTVADASYFNGFKAQIGESTSGESITFNKNVYAGSKYTGSGDKNAVIVNPLTINCGSMKFVSGGSLVSMDSNLNTVTFKGSTELIINGGSFASYIMAGAGKVTKGNFIQNGNINVTINGGQFGVGFCCGAIYGSSANVGDGASTINGDLLLTITGGIFEDGTWIFGGSASGKEAKAYSCVNTINGNTCITIDASGNSIQLGNVVAGSHGYGVINGNTQLVFKGSGANLTISGQLWGGCSGDSYADDEITFKSVLANTSVGEGKTKRILSFDGFNGALNCTEIKCFNTFEARNGTAVTLNSSAYDLSEIKNWSFEYGSSLTNSDFDNDFYGDVLDLDLTGWNQSSSPWTVMSNSHDNAFVGFDSFGSVKLGGETAAYNTTTGAWVSENYRLALSGQSMVFSNIIA